MAHFFMPWQGVAAPIHFISISYKKQANFIAKAAPFQMRKRPVTFYCNRPLLFVFLVGATGFEPATPCSQSRCATRLRHAPCRSPYREKRAAWQARRAALPCPYFAAGAEASYSVSRDCMSSFTGMMRFTRPTLAPQKAKPRSRLPFMALIRACAMQ